MNDRAPQPGSSERPDSKASLTEDYNWVRQAQQGDAQGIAKLYEKYHVQLKHFLYRFTGNVTAAEDLVQETFARVLQKIHQFECTGSVIGWIYQIGKNLSLMRLRKVNRHPETSLNKPASGNVDTDLEIQDLVQDVQKLPSDVAEQQELIRFVERTLPKVPENFRDVLILVDIEGFSYKEVAQMLDCPINTVSTRLARGRKFMAKELKALELGAEDGQTTG